MGKRLTSRFVNGILAIAIAAFFAVHGVLGAISGFVDIPRNAAWIVWAGVVMVGAHVLASIVTSREQLTDPARPPSARKKRHLALKWATGTALAVAAAIHIAIMRTTGETLTGGGNAGLASLLALIALLAIHSCVGVRSLLKDIGADRGCKNVVRAALCAIAAALAIACIAAFAL